MKKQNQFLTLLLILCAWFEATTAPAQSPGAVVAWGYNGSGQTTVPAVAQSGVTAIAVGEGHTVPLLPSLNVRPNGNELLLSWPTNVDEQGLTVKPLFTWPQALLISR